MVIQKEILKKEIKYRPSNQMFVFLKKRKQKQKTIESWSSYFFVLYVSQICLKVSSWATNIHGWGRCPGNKGEMTGPWTPQQAAEMALATTRQLPSARPH